jgi:uncharacterized protein with PQ loop repeat
MMHPETIIAIAFSITNIFRLFAYLPQIVLLIGERETPAVSVATWAIFLASNAVTALYAAIVVVDLTMSHIFLASMICCAFISGWFSGSAGDHVILG